MLVPVLLGSLWLTGCAGLLPGGFVPGASSARVSIPRTVISGVETRASGDGEYVPDSSVSDDSTARNQWESDARMDDWLNEQSVEQETDAANQTQIDDTNSAAASAAASAAVGIGQ